MTVKTIGLDLGKQQFELHGVDARGRRVLHRRLSRGRLLRELGKLPRCLVGMEACGGAHYWAREVQRLGHRVKVMAPQYVKPYVRTNKNDANDAEAVCEAVQRPGVPGVAVKGPEELALQGLHRVRERLVGTRTAVVNQLRGLLAEHGVVLPRGRAKVRAALPELAGDGGQRLPGLLRELLADGYRELCELERRIAGYDRRIAQAAAADERCRRLLQVRGIGPLTATAMVGHMGAPGAYANGRQYSAALGLVPRQYSSGGHQRLLGISKRGDRYLRKLLVHGARSLVSRAQRSEDRLSRWARAVEARRGRNRATVAVANKLARIGWALLAHGGEYRAG